MPREPCYLPYVPIKFTHLTNVSAALADLDGASSGCRLRRLEVGAVLGRSAATAQDNYNISSAKNERTWVRLGLVGPNQIKSSH